MHAPKPVIFGCEGTALTQNERDFFHEHQPLGFILFARNCQDKAQVSALVQELKSAVGHDQLYFLIDQEGGRVARLKPPHWRATPAAGLFADLAQRDAVAAERAVYLNARLIAEELTELGLNADCAPMLDLRLPGAHDVVGDRAFGSEADQVIALGRAMANGLHDGGVLPIIKHIPGHGRATVDSHELLPRVETPLAELEATDFKPFRVLAREPWAMTAHIVFTALDANAPVTFSPAALRYIRDVMGYPGMLISDDLSMQALSGDFSERAQRALDAGCDILLHCNGKMAEMEPIAEACPPVLEGERLTALYAGLGALSASSDFAAEAAEAELAGLLREVRNVA